MTDFDPIEDAAQFLASLRRLRMRGDALPVASRPETYDQALDVQDRIVELACAPVIGWKIGCTSRAAQDYLGIPHPFPGRVFGDTTFDSPAALPADMFTQRGIESEFILILKHDLPPPGEPYTGDDVASAVAAVAPAIEVIEPRYRDWLRVGLASAIADNGGHGALIRGSAKQGWPVEALDQHPVTLSVDGEQIAEGSGAEVLGHPLEALAWLANQLNARDDMLRAGQLVTTGTCTGYHEVAEGSDVIADFGELGRVMVRFG